MLPNPGLFDEQKRRIYDDLSHYPTPITACDQQFNYLLEQQACLAEELRRWHALQAEGESAQKVADFVDRSRVIGTQQKHEILRLLEGDSTASR